MRVKRGKRENSGKEAKKTFQLEFHINKEVRSWLPEATVEHPPACPWLRDLKIAMVVLLKPQPYFPTQPEALKFLLNYFYLREARAVE